MKIELILLGLIAVVLIVDFILRGIKKKDTSEKGLEKFEGAFEESIKQSKFNYILSRKRNIVSFIILVHLLKILIHYFVYPKKNLKSSLRFNGGDFETVNLIKYFSFRWHIENVYFVEVWLFITSFIILVVLVWLFNDKIKAR
jgi:hypothetical protein